jgi:hypothetical protein
VLFDLDVTTCKTTNKGQKESCFTTSVPVHPKLFHPRFREKGMIALVLLKKAAFVIDL